MNDPEMCTVEFSKNLEKGGQDVGERKKKQIVFQRFPRQLVVTRSQRTKQP